MYWVIPVGNPCKVLLEIVPIVSHGNPSTKFIGYFFGVPWQWTDYFSTIPFRIPLKIDSVIVFFKLFWQLFGDRTSFWNFFVNFLSFLQTYSSISFENIWTLLEKLLNEWSKQFAKELPKMFPMKFPKKIERNTMHFPKETAIGSYEWTSEEVYKAIAGAILKEIVKKKIPKSSQRNCWKNVASSLFSLYGVEDTLIPLLHYPHILPPTWNCVEGLVSRLKNPEIRSFISQMFKKPIKISGTNTETLLIKLYQLIKTFSSSLLNEGIIISMGYLPMLFSGENMIFCVERVIWKLSMATS